MATRATRTELPKRTEKPEAETTETAEDDGKIEVVGGQVYRDGRLIGYTDKGAVSAVPGGPKDPTIVPGGHTVDDAPAEPVEPGVQGA
jgi:hypothetical protein